MRDQARDRHTPLFILAVALVVTGAAALLITTGLLPDILSAWPLALFRAAVVYAYLGLSLRWSVSAAFIGVFVALSSAVYAVCHASGLALSSFWPLLVISAGVGVFAAGLVRYRKLLAGYLVPALAFVFLGSFFSIFSFRISRLGFKAFLALWWPALLIAAGLTLLALWALGGRAPARKTGGGHP